MKLLIPAVAALIWAYNGWITYDTAFICFAILISAHSIVELKET